MIVPSSRPPAWIPGRSANVSWAHRLSFFCRYNFIALADIIIYLCSHVRKSRSGGKCFLVGKSEQHMYLVEIAELDIPANTLGLCLLCVPHGIPSRISFLISCEVSSLSAVLVSALRDTSGNVHLTCPARDLLLTKNNSENFLGVIF